MERIDSQINEKRGEEILLEGIMEEEIINNIKDLKDTSTWSKELEKNIWSHCHWKDEQREIVKMYINIRRVYHGENLLLYLTQLNVMRLTEDKTTFLIIPKNYYMASTIKLNSIGIILSNGDVKIGSTVYYNLCVDFCLQMVSCGLISDTSRLQLNRNFRPRLIQISNYENAKSNGLNPIIQDFAFFLEDIQKFEKNNIKLEIEEWNKEHPNDLQKMSS